MKRKFALLIAVILCLSLAACNKTSAPEQVPQESHTETTNPESHTETTSTQSTEDTQSSIELAGPWRLDTEKNDLAVFTDSLDLFPGYAEWGAGMEIRSNGQMSWYIGTVGGSGTYSVEDDVLHAALVNDMDQKDMAIDLRILVENDEAILAMDYHNMTIYWAYGDQAHTPATGNDENGEEATYPGADTVEIVNLRGDETTVYKLADGTYMDREERRFTYDGMDTWTDENGGEWNEVAKD